MPCASVNTLKPRLDTSPCDYCYIEVKIKMNYGHLSQAYWKSVNYLYVCQRESRSLIAIRVKLTLFKPGE